MDHFRKSKYAVFLLVFLLFLWTFRSTTATSDSGAGTDTAVGKTAETISAKESHVEKAKGKEKKVTFNFVDVDITAVVKFISEVTGKNFVFDEKVKGNITIIAPSKLSVDDAFSLFTSVLELKGFTIIPSGKVYKIVPVSQAKQSGIEIQTSGGAQLTDAYIIRLVQLKSISASKALNFLQPLVSREGHISSFGPGNMLMIVDSVNNIEKLLGVLDSIDKPGVEEPELVLLKYANAEDVVKIITDAAMLGSRTLSSAVRAPRPGETAMTTSVEEARANIFADSRLNAIVMIADKQEKEAMKRLIALLDIPLPEATSKINVFFLEYADATELSKVLEGMITGISSQARSGQSAQPGQPGQAPRSPFESGGKIILSADKATNSIIVVASPGDYQNLLQVIKQLDRRRRQVYVEAMIVEASIAKLRDIGVKWRVAATKNGEPVAIGGFGSIDSNALQNILQGLSGFTAGGLGNFINVPLTTIGTDGTVTSSTLSVPGFAALFNLNEFRDVVNVLSTPQILTSDNKEAEIVVGENVPFVSKRERDITTTNTVLSSIDRKDVGITLRLTPQITEGDYVKLDLYQEISALQQGESENIIINVGPTITKRSTKTSVVVKDNQTVVIGGLMQEREEQSVTKFPLLGDIPVLGLLFRQKSVSKQKTNLLVFLTPHIVKESERLAKLTDEKRLAFAKAEDRYAQGELLVKFRDGTPEKRVSEILAAEGASLMFELNTKGLYRIKLGKGQDVRDAVKIFNNYAEVQYAEPNYVMKIQ
jgi:general secretion pathway protein D